MSNYPNRPPRVLPGMAAALAATARAQNAADEDAAAKQDIDNARTADALLADVAANARKLANVEAVLAGYEEQIAKQEDGPAKSLASTLVQGIRDAIEAGGR